MSRLSAALRRAGTGSEGSDRSPLDETLDEALGEFEAVEHAGSDQVDVADVKDVEDLSAALVANRIPVATRAETSPEEQPPFDPADDVIEDGMPRFKSFNSRHAEKLVVSPAMPQPLREHYRRLAATLHHAQVESGVKVLMVSSAVPDEGKTLTATNLALTLSESYQRRVLLIDADLRRPSLDTIFQMPKVFGLNEALTSNPPRRVSVIQISRHLSLLTAGAPDPDPMSTLTSDRMRRLLAEAAASYEWVIIDTPPVGILTDAKLLGSMVDAALLVIRAGKTPSQLIQRAVDALGRERILGVVLNRAEPRGFGAGYSYYDSYYYGGRKT